MQKFINNWSTTLTQSITVSDTTIHIDINAANQLAAGFQQGDYYLLTLDDGVNVEIIKVASINNDQLVVERGQEDTNAYSWDLGVKVESRVTAGSLTQLLIDFSSGGSSESILSGSVTNEWIEGPGSFDIILSNNLYKLGFGGPGLKTVNLPTGLDANRRHTFIVMGQNTGGGSITVQFGDGGNVSWEGGVAPTFPASGALVETMLFTLDGGGQWYGKSYLYG